MERAAFDDLVTGLKEGETPRVPSLLVSVFGDLAQGPGARVPAPVLGRLMDLIGVKPEAMRVALHRLRKDGWIESHRSGRSSAYALTELGRGESAAASPRIYSASPPAERAWMVVADPARTTSLDPSGGVWVAGNVLVTGRAPDTEVFAVSLSPAVSLPDWMTRKICDPDLADLSEDLAGRFERAKETPWLDFTAIERAALRVLIVHSWRRVVLKAPILPDYVFPKPWHGPSCRVAVSAMLDRLPKPGISDLEACLVA